MRSKAETNFIDQYARKLVVEWGRQTIVDGSICDVMDPMDSECFSVAIEKGWVTKRTPYKLTAKGFEVAVSFLKR